MSASDSPGEEFREIDSCGGKFEMVQKEEGISLRVTGTGPVHYFQMGIALDRDWMEYWPIRGIDQRPAEQPPIMVPALLPSDKTGLWGRTCPKCKAYFRTNGIGKYMFCPYCDCRAPAAAFTTENQRAFLNRLRELWLTAIANRENVTIDLDSLASELPQNRPSWTPREEQQQFHFVCEKCQMSSDVLGEYASCPACGYRNSLVVFKRHWEELDTEFRRADAEIQDPHERGKVWKNLLPRFVSAFEAMADDLRNHLLKLRLTIKRRKEVERLSFQRIFEAEERLRLWFGIEIFAGLKPEDKEFLNREYNRRHILIHKAGRVDQEYLDKTGDPSVKLHQSLRIGSEEITRLSELLRQCANNFFDQFANIS